MPTPELATTLVATDDDLLLAAEAHVRAYCGWHIAPVRQSTVTVPWQRAATVVLPTLHLLSVDAVVASDGTVLDPSSYRASPEGVVRLTPPRTGWAGVHLTITRDGAGDDDYWPFLSAGDYTLTFTHGYAQVPADVAAAVRALATQAKTNPMLLQARTRGPFTETYARADVPVQAALESVNRYRLPPRP